MNAAILIALLVLTVISGLFASAMEINTKKDAQEEKNEKTVVDMIGISNRWELQKYKHSKNTALVVFVLSLAGLIALYIIKG